MTDPDANHASDDKKLFFEALDLPETERIQFLDRACGNDSARWRRIERMLEIEASDDGLPEPSPRLLGHALETVTESKVGDRITYFGDYELLEVIGSGATGVVYRARQKSLNRFVAIKLIRGLLVSSDADRRRFEFEAQAGAALNHPHIVPTYELGEHQGQPYCCMKLIEGETLGAALATFTNDFPRAVRLMIRVARAVHAAHQHGILHRDLKPANILLDQDGEPHISDFGLAKSLEGGEALTLSSQMLGTPYYMAPEQVDAGSGALTVASDVYSLGAILYEVLSGRPPFQGGSVLETLRKARDEAPPPVQWSSGSSKARDLEVIALKCLEKDPAIRYGSAQDLAKDLERWSKGEPIEARPVPLTERLIKWTRRKPALAGCVAMACVIVLTLAVGGPMIAFRVSHLQANTEKARQLASARGDTIRQNLYLAEMHLATEALMSPGGAQGAATLLDKWVPQSGESDLRGWEWHFLNSQTDHGERKLRFGGPVQHAIWNAQADQIACIGDRGRLNIWDVDKDEPRWVLRSPVPIFEISWHPQENRVAAGCLDGIIRIWSTQTGELESEIETGEKDVWTLDWSPDGRRFVFGGHGRMVNVWNLQDRAVERQLPAAGKAEFVLSARWSPNGRHFAACSRSRMWIWNLEDANPIITHHQPEKGFQTMAWSPDGRWLAVSGGLGLAEIIDATSGAVRCQMDGQQQLINGLAWSRDGRYIAGGGRDLHITVWAAEDGKQVGSFHDHLRTVSTLDWHPDGDRLLSGGTDATCRIWSMKQLRRWIIHREAGRVYRVAWHPSGERVAWGGRSRLRVGDPDLIPQTQSTEKVGDRPCWSRDGQALLTRHRNQVLCWDPSNQTARVFAAFPNGCTVDDLAFSPSGDRVVATASDHLPMAWSYPNGEQLWQVQVEDKLLMLNDEVAWHPHDAYLAFGGPGGLVIADPEDGRVLEIIAMNSNGTKALEWSPDGCWLALGVGDRQVVLCEESTAGWEMKVMQGHSGSVNDVAWSPDGLRLASGGAGGAIRLWDPHLQKETMVLKGHQTAIIDLSWSPDGQRLVSTSYDRTIRMWAIRSR